MPPIRMTGAFIVSLAGEEGAGCPVRTCGLTRPRPVAKTWISDPVRAGFEDELSVESSFKTAACADPGTRKIPGASSAKPTVIAGDATPLDTTTTPAVEPEISSGT